MMLGVSGIGETMLGETMLDKTKLGETRLGETLPFRVFVWIHFRRRSFHVIVIDVIDVIRFRRFKFASRLSYKRPHCVSPFLFFFLPLLLYLSLSLNLSFLYSPVKSHHQSRLHGTLMTQFLFTKNGDPSP